MSKKSAHEKTTRNAAHKAADGIGAEHFDVITLPIHTLNKAAPRHGHIEAQLNSADQRLGMRRLFDSLVKEGAKLANGRPVASYADAIRFVAERVSQCGATKPPMSSAG